MEDLRGQKVLVTGARGFIGLHLCRRLLAEGAEVHAVSRQLVDTPGAGPRWWQADLSDAGSTRALIERVRPAALFHLAGLASGSHDLDMVPATFRDNLQTTVNLLTAAAQTGVGKVVLPGSMEEPDDLDHSQIPRSPYAASKWACSAYARLFHALYRVPVVNTRVFMVYGPEQPDQAKLIPYVIRSFLRGEPPKLASGARLIDWIYVEDVADALLHLARAQGADGETVDIGSGSLISIRDLVERIHSIVGSSVTSEFGTLADRPHERQPVADAASTQRKYGWTAATPLDRGLRITVDWYRDRMRKELLSDIPISRR